MHLESAALVATIVRDVLGGVVQKIFAHLGAGWLARGRPRGWPGPHRHPLTVTRAGIPQLVALLIIFAVPSSFIFAVPSCCPASLAEALIRARHDGNRYDAY